MRILVVLLILGAWSPSSATAALECESGKKLSYAEQIARLDPKFDLDLVDFDFLNGGGAVAGYEYEVEPAYANGLYSRTDRWKIDTKAVPSDVFEISEGFDVSGAAGLKFAAEARFIRFVKDPCQAMTLMPYTPRRMPLRARRAIGEKFNIGDYFFFRGSSAFVASAEVLSMLSSGFWGAGFSASYLLEGFYQLHIVRLNETQIRMKVLGHRGQRGSASVKVGWQGDFEVFSVSALDNGLEKIVNTTPIRLSANKSKANIFMLDYVLDLSDPDVAAAFDKVLANASGFKQLRLANPFKDQGDLTGMLLLDLSPLEKLFQEDRRAGNIGRLKRNLRTSSSQTSAGWGVDLGNRIFGWEWDKQSADSVMHVRNDDNSVRRYLLRAWETRSEGRFLYNWSKTKKRAGMRALFETDKNDKNARPINLVSFLTRKKNRLSHGKFLKIKKKLKKALPDAVFKMIPWRKWGQEPSDKYTNFGMRYDFVVAPEALTEAPQLSAEEIGRMFTDHTFKKGLGYEDFFWRHRSVRERIQRWVSPQEQFEESLEIFSRWMAELLNKKTPFKRRMKVLGRLKSNELFQASGLGFLMTLLPDRMQELYHLNIYLSANESKVEFNYGDSRLSALYKKLLTIKAALDDDGLDLLREAQSLSIAY